MSKKSLGRLEKVNLRNFWESEAGDFTPWLATDENIELLGEAIGLELAVEAQEKDVGRFRADILCKDTADEHWVLIENQLERTDHTHLGQLLTYAAGLNARTIIWVSAKFTEEHRATLDWLNDITDETFNFFGLEVELWRIGDSIPAPKFNVVSKPNNWTRSIADAAKGIAETAMTETKQLQLEFWTDFAKYLELKESVIKPTKPLPGTWMAMGVGRTGFKLEAIVATFNNETQSYAQGEVRAELRIVDAEAKAFFELLQIQKLEIEQEFGETLNWYSQDDIKACRVYVTKSANIQDREQWPELFEWLRLRLERLHQVFRERIRALDATEWQPVNTAKTDDLPIQS